MHQRFADGLMGALWGVLIGGLLGFGVCIWVFDEPLLFSGDTIVIGAGICGVLGYLCGESFLEWMKEHWWWFH